jgi:hypothetical protein
LKLDKKNEVKQMPAKHSPEPWKDWYDDDVWISKLDACGKQIDFDIDRNRERIIACINACAGIATEDLERFAKLGKWGLEAVKAFK